MSVATSNYFSTLSVIFIIVVINNSEDTDDLETSLPDVNPRKHWLGYIEAGLSVLIHG